MYPIRDPQLVTALNNFNQLLPNGIDLDNIPAMRVVFDELFTAMAEQAPPIDGVITSDHFASSTGDQPDVLVRIYQPENRTSDILPALLWIHGGGYVLGNINGDDLKVKEMTLALNCVIASVEYRLAPEHPFPAPLEDCYTALKWLTDNATKFGVDAKKIAIGGASAGGGLTAGLALLARDRGEVNIAYQFLLYPMIDDSNVQQANEDIPDTPVWSRANNLAGWRAYLSDQFGSDNVSPYAAAIRAEDLSGLPPTYIGVGTPDLFRNENMCFAQKLIKAGVPTEFHVYPDGFHGFDILAPESDIAQRFITEQMTILSQTLS